MTRSHILSLTHTRTLPFSRSRACVDSVVRVKIQTGSETDADWKATTSCRCKSRYGDIRYLYSHPGTKPPHHRFDKGSYVYLFENATERRSRIEIANQPRTEDQDAFEGFLDKVRLTHNAQLHGCLVSLALEDSPSGLDEWHLPTYDPRNENKYHYQLQAVDIYFWGPYDAADFVAAARRTMSPSRVEVHGGPAPTHSPVELEVSDVVQRLEAVAVSSDEGRGHQVTGQASSQLKAVALSDRIRGSLTTQQARFSFNMTPPPVMQLHASSGDGNAERLVGVDSRSAISHLAPVAALPASAPAPFAYNPAAPAAPESIIYRETTPPPDDGVDPRMVASALERDPSFSPTPGSTLGGAGLPPRLLDRASTMPVGTPLASPYPGGEFPAYQVYPSHTSSPPSAYGTHPTGTDMGVGINMGLGGGGGRPAFGQYAVHNTRYDPAGDEHDIEKTTSKNVIWKSTEVIDHGIGGIVKRFEKKFG